MADNVFYTDPGTGTTFATDDVAGVHYQRIKLNDGTADSTTPINSGNGTATNALRVTVASDSTGVVGLAAGTNNIGDVDVLTLPALPAGTNNIGDVDVLTLPALPTGSNTIGAVNLAQYTPASGRLPVDGSGVTQPVSIASTVPVSLAYPTGQDIYSVAFQAQAKGADRNYLTVHNNDASKKVDILLVLIAQESTAAITGLGRGYRIFRFNDATGPTAGGASATPVQLNTSGMSALDADVTCRIASAGSVTVPGVVETMPLAVGAVCEEETGSSEPVTLFDWRWLGLPITLNTDEGITVRQDSTAGTGVLSGICYFRVR